MANEGENKPSRALDQNFQRACAMLFGKPLGNLKEFEEYLTEGMFDYRLFNSCASGKEVMMSSPHYQERERYISQEELPLVKIKPFSINQIKDIDSLFEAASERAFYCGNKVFGKNYNVLASDNCVNCTETYRSHNVYNSKYVGCCGLGRFAEGIYGVSMFWNCSYAIRSSVCNVEGAKRSFECHYSTGIADSYYTFNCSHCSNLIFCFNLRGKNYAIGNLELPKERYLEIRKKLVSEMAGILAKNKRIFSLADIVAQEGGGKGGAADFPRESMPVKTSEAFGKTSEIILGKRHNAKKAEKWLLEKAVGVWKVEGKFGTQAYRVDLKHLAKIPDSKTATLDEGLSNAEKLRLSLPDIENANLGTLAKCASKIAIFAFESREGESNDYPGTPSTFNASNVYRMWWAVASKLSAFSSIVTESEYVFGGYLRALNSSFCINCFNCTCVKACFECDSCYQCHSCYFCHNCENVENGIFCFNAKGLRYAVCNQEVGKAEFERVKKMLLDYVNGELEEKGKMEMGIFEFGLP